MVIEEIAPSVADLLRRAAEARRLVPFRQFHALFDGDFSDRDKYDTLEAAAKTLAPLEAADYTALMAKRSDDCPGTGFYDTFMMMRRDEYEKIAGRMGPLGLSRIQRIEIANLERTRVYLHAQQRL